MKNLFLAKRKEMRKFGEGQTVFSQGDPAKNVIYIQEGGVKLTVVNEAGKEAVVAILGPGDLLGEECLGGFSVRRTTATAMALTILFLIEKSEMARLLHEDRDLSDRFIAHLLAQKAMVEEDLSTQLLNSSEKRLAHILMRLAHSSIPSDSREVLPIVSQEVLAEMVGTTRSRVNFFMNRFRKLGYIEYGNSQCVPRVNKSLRRVIQQD